MSHTSPKCRHELTVNRQLTQLDLLAKRLEDRITKIEEMIASHSDPIYRERLTLQAEIEKSFFSQHSNRIKFNTYSKTDRVHDAAQLLDLKRIALFAEKTYKSYLYEWCRRSVRDASYFVIDTKLTKHIERHRIHEKERWTAFEQLALKSNWDELRRTQEARVFQQRLDKEITVSLERDLEVKHALGLTR